MDFPIPMLQPLRKFQQTKHGSEWKFQFQCITEVPQISTVANPGFGGFGRFRPDRWRNAFLLTEVHVHRNSPTLKTGHWYAKSNRGSCWGVAETANLRNPYKNQVGFLMSDMGTTKILILMLLFLSSATLTPPTSFTRIHPESDKTTALWWCISV